MTNTNAHVQSNLPLRKHTIPVDENTVEVFHYDVSPNGALRNTKPLGSYVDDSTILYYDMADTFTNSNGTYVVDKSPHGNYGKVMGPTIANGRNGKAMNFDGVDDYVDINMVLPDNGSIEMWYKPTSFYNYNTLWDNSSSANDWECWIYNTGVLTAKLSASQPPVSFNLTTLGGIDIWYHVILTWEKTGNTHLFVNGVLRSTQVTVWSNPGNNLYISGNNGNTKGTGISDKVVILNRAVTAEEVLERYNEGIYALREDGKYNKAIAIEENTENLLLDSDVPIKSSSYAIKDYYFSIPPIAGETYTISLKGDLASGKSYFGLYNSGGSVSPTSLSPSTRTPDGIYRRTFTWTIGASSNTYLRVYHMPSSFIAESSIEWIQLEKKSSATSFTIGSREQGKLMYNNPLPNASEFTISFWMYLGDKPTSHPAYESIMNISNGTDANGLYINYYNNTTLRFFTYNSAGVAQIASTNTSLLRNQWAYIVVKRDAARLYGYINGELQCTVNNSGTVSLDGILELGTRRTAPGQSANILIDELRIDKVARTSEEIASWYVSDSPFFPRGNERVVL